MLLEDVQKLKDELEGLIQSYMRDGCVEGFSATQLNWPSAEDVISTLRAGQPPEATYALLRQFAIMNRNQPIIETEKGNLLYIDFNPCTDKLLLWIGAKDEFVNISEVEGRRLYALVIQERYDFFPYGNGTTICRLKLEREELLDRVAQLSGRPGQFTPCLYFYLYDNPSDLAICSLRTEWTPLEGVTAPRATAEGVTPEAAGDAGTNCSEKPLLGQIGFYELESQASEGSKLRPACDPRIYGKSGNNYPHGQSPDQLSA